MGLHQSQAFQMLMHAKDTLADPQLRDQYHYWIRRSHGQYRVQGEQVIRAYNACREFMDECTLFIEQAHEILAMRAAPPRPPSPPTQNFRRGRRRGSGLA